MKILSTQPTLEVDPAAAIAELRATRVGLAGVLGGALALGGACLQHLLRNPLADPFVLGISAGGTLAVVASIVLGLPAWLPGAPGATQYALLGSASVLVILLVSRGKFESRYGEAFLPLVGFLVNSLCGASLLLLLTLSEPARLGEAQGWLVGALRDVNPRELLLAGVIIGVCSGSIVKLAPAIRVLGFGDEFAASVGFSPRRVRTRALFAVSLAVAACVSLSGAIGFVGLLVPHWVRRLQFRSVRLEWVCVFLYGAILLMWGDLLGRVVARPLELPVGVFTTLVGVPAFLVLILRKGMTKGMRHGTW